MHLKDFDTWGGLKVVINNRVVEEIFHVREREIRYVHLGVNIGFEQDGRGGEYRRPVLVLKKIGNVFSVLPMTTK